MSSIPLPALHVQQPESPLDSYAKALQIRQMQQQQQMLPGQLQMQQQQVQQQQMQTQQMQQEHKDQIAFRQAMSAPEMQGKTIGEIADVLAKQGNISVKSWMGAKKADLEHRKELAGLDETQLKNRKSGQEQTQQIYGNVMNMPDQQLAQKWPDIVQQVKSIPGNEKLQLDPNQPMSKQQLAQFGPFLSMGNAYFDQELKRRTEAEDLKKKQLENAAGGSLSDESRFAMDYLAAQKLPNTPENRQKAFDVYTKKTKLDPAQMRANIFLQRPTEVLDPNNPGATVMVPAKESYGMAGKGSVGQKVLSAQTVKAQPQFVAFDTADQHLQLIEKAGKALQNGNIQVLNQIANTYGVAVGKDPVTTFKSLTTVAAPEIVRASAGSGQMSEREIEVARNNFDPKLSPQQITTNVAAMRGLMAGKKAALQKNLEGLKQGNTTGGGPQAGMIRARDPQGKLHEAPAGTPLPAGWKLEQ